MDHEEREEIPWSNLVAEVEESLDRRWLYVGGVALALVIGFVGLRLFDRPTQPNIPEAPGVVSTELVDEVLGETVTPETTLTTSAVLVSEEDLRADDPGTLDAVLSTRSEWFVSDYFTVDGSPETALSVRGALVPELQSEPLPHESDTSHTYVEWARTYRIAPVEGGAYVVEVAYRSIIEAEGAFERLPVRTVRLEIQLRDGVPLVSELPSTVVSPTWTG